MELYGKAPLTVRNVKMTLRRASQTETDAACFVFRITKMYQTTGDNDQNEWSHRKEENDKGTDCLL